MEGLNPFVGARRIRTPAAFPGMALLAGHTLLEHATESTGPV